MTPSAEPLPPGMRPDAVEMTATVVEQARMARDTYRVRLRCPELARRITPGQFFMVRPAGGSDPLLGRPRIVQEQPVDDKHGPSHSATVTTGDASRGPACLCVA